MAIPEILKGRLSIPVVASPLFIISGPELVIAQCKAGVVGSFPSLNARPVEVLDEWLTQINAELDAYNLANPDKPAAPFAVNQIVHNSNDRLMQDVALCVKHKVPIVITSLGARPEVFEAIHSYGGIVLHDVINNRFAKKAIEKGADGLICVAAGAGGLYCFPARSQPAMPCSQRRRWAPTWPISVQRLSRPKKLMPTKPTSNR